MDEISQPADPVDFNGAARQRWRCQTTTDCNQGVPATVWQRQTGQTAAVSLKTRTVLKNHSGRQFPVARAFPYFLAFGIGAALLCLGQGLWQAYGLKPARPKNVDTAALPPWGRLEATPLRLPKPPVYLPDPTVPVAPTVWHFPSWNRIRALAFLKECQLTRDQLSSLEGPSCWFEGSDGTSLTPPIDVVLSLGRPVRERLYAHLARSEENVYHRHPFRIRLSEGDDWFKGLGLPERQAELARNLTYRQGQALCFADVAAAQRALSRTEFAHLLGALYSSDTLMLRLRIQPGDEIDTLVDYWSQGGRRPSVKPLLASLARQQGGEIDVVELLPPLPRTWLYTYPSASDSPQPESDCFSTSLNFFRDVPEKGFLQPSLRNEEFRQHYELVPKAERLGDVIVFADASRITRHACVFVAEDIVFTKNGARNSHPWVFMRLDLVRELYDMDGTNGVYVFRHRGR